MQVKELKTASKTYIMLTITYDKLRIRDLVKNESSGRLSVSRPFLFGTYIQEKCESFSHLENCLDFTASKHNDKQVFRSLSSGKCWSQSFSRLLTEKCHCELFKPMICDEQLVISNCLVLAIAHH